MALKLAMSNTNIIGSDLRSALTSDMALERTKSVAAVTAPKQAIDLKNKLLPKHKESNANRIEPDLAKLCENVVGSMLA